jgi:Na+:H+ antiporter, NhaA family
MASWLQRSANVLRHPAAGGVVLALSALAALLISNSPWAATYTAWTQMPGELRLGTVLHLQKPLVVWVNDLWMAVFFFLVGLEIKRERISGDLRSPQQAALPLVAALGGMVVPALIFAAVNWGDDVALRGWAIPAATDIAFALAIVLVLGPRVPASLKVFLTAVAIIDDLGAIVIIALFYTSDLSWPMLAAAAVCLVALLTLNRMGVRRIGPYVLVGLLMWLCVLKSGVHATLAGVLTAMAVPHLPGETAREAAAGRHDLPGDAHDSPLLKAEHALQPWVAFLVLPAFAFVNAGVSLAGVNVATLAQPITLGIALGLVVGKSVGIFGAVQGMLALKLAPMPAGASKRQLLGVCLLCGVGFTMSLFIGSLAFEGLAAAYETQVKLGVLLGSCVAALLGVAVLWPSASKKLDL